MLGSTKGTRMHSIVVALRDDLFSLWYFDASGVVRTCSSQSGEKLSLINDFERVAAIFVALVYCTPEQFGAFPTHLIRPPDNTPFPDSFPLESLEGCTINLDTNETKKPYRLITLGRHIYTQYTIVGRRTSVYEGTTLTPKRRRRRVAVKIALQNITRASEINIISLARHKGVDHLPEILNRADLWRLSDSDIRKALEVAYDDRILRVIVTPCYVPLCVQLAKNPDSLTTMVKQITDCIHDLRHKALILHRDVSEGNIMYKKRDGEDWFLLIDFDLAVGLRENGQPTGPSARHRTGTLPFMAVDLIDDIAAQESANRFYPWEPSLQHSIRHDFESLFWVSLWCAVCVVSSNHKVDPELLQVGRDWLSKWEAPDKSYMSIADRKQKIITKPGELKNAPLSPSFHHLRRWLDVFRACISAGSEALAHWKMEHPTASLTSAANFHLHETGDDEITRSKILEAFENYDKLPTPEPETEEVVAAGDEKYEEIDWSKYSIVVADNPEIEEDYVSGDEEEDY
ncbi:hypothetical protein BDY19DRAFT_450284 [Irpex rosettiformis]|uniref:Uncharacterized protein n=1 Tax=Irpex rosettiformis TaxID=378272 RepID=A0ACB8TTA6_9APHY|nr:hypothetical protein BDY19DRAFT_450284 [Irpex rosettiformis]